MKIHYIFITVLQIISIIPCLSKRYYLLNFTDSKNSTKFTVSCRTDVDCGTLRKGGWRFENGGWIFEETDLKRDCCKLQSNRIDFPKDIPRPPELHLQFKIQFRRCTPYGHRCREYIRFGVIYASKEYKETVKPLKTASSFLLILH